MASRSPFPGMDPWLESHWGDLHHSIIQYSRDLLAEQLPASLFAAVEETVYLLAADDEDRGRVRPDVSVFDLESGLADSGQAGGLAVADPVRIRLVEPPVHLGHIEIRKLEGDQPLVTAIEVISPTNKLDARNRRRYIEKRQAYYAAGAAVVEIDLIRAGEPLIDVPWERVKPHQLTPYRACIRRVPAPDEDLEVEYYPLPLQSRLPPLAIPLRRGDKDVVLDLQQPIDRAYAMGRYGLRLDYKSPPPGPVLGSNDAAWVAGQLSQSRV